MAPVDMAEPRRVELHSPAGMLLYACVMNAIAHRLSGAGAA